MGKQKKTRKFAEVKRLLNPKDLQPCARPLSSGPAAGNGTSCAEFDRGCVLRPQKKQKVEPKDRVRHMCAGHFSP